MSSTSAPPPPSTGSRPWSPRVRRSAAVSRAGPPRVLSTRFSPWSPPDSASTPLGEIAARYNSPPGIVFLPVHDAPTIHYALTWRSTDDSPTLHTLAQTAADLGPISM
ncbi:hypothetical protein QF027_009391 [Streptomyces canus]|nr:hypothetical protein [Streptomyces canus]MDQ0766756.1 hypothetical protein [Streptomyces canus]